MTTRPNCQQLPSWSTNSSPTEEKPTDTSVQKPNFPPSPSASGSLRQKAQRKRGRSIEDLLETPSPEPDALSADQDSGITGHERKRSCAGYRAAKRRKALESGCSTPTFTGSQSDVLEHDDPLTSTPVDDSPEALGTNDAPVDPVQYWTRNQRWPENFANMSQERSISPKKRASSSSYTQRRKDGEVPEAYSSAYENHLAEYGMVMLESAGRSRVSEQSQQLCAQLLRGVHSQPKHTMFPLSQFLLAWDRAQDRNEARIFRDITPLLVPSPELLYLSGHEELKHLVEEISVEWTKCRTLAGPRPKPDLAIGLSSSAFSEEEIAKLKNHTSLEQPTALTNNLYFPFVLCEAKCGDQGIRRADRQNMHSASIAVNAIVSLGDTLGVDKVNALDGQTLVYSISHDNERVKLYGHFVHQRAFYRYPIASFVLNFDGNNGWKRTHDFFREVYRLVYPVHLKRIQGALATMADPRKVSLTSSMSSEGGEESESQELEPSKHSSQENAIFKKPGTPPSKRRKDEMALLREQLTEQQRQSEGAKEQALLWERRFAELADEMSSMRQLLPRK